MVSASEQSFGEFGNSADKIIYLLASRLDLLIVIAKVSKVAQMLNRPPLWDIYYVVAL